MASAVSIRSVISLSPSTASTASSVLVIIDAQNEYATGKLTVSGVEESRVVIASVLEKYRVPKAPVIHVVHATPAGAPVFTPGTDLAKELEGLTPIEGEHVVTKQRPGSFTGTELEELLKGTWRSKDAVGTRHIPKSAADEMKKVALSEISDAFGTIIQSGDIQ